MGSSGIRENKHFNYFVKSYTIDEGKTSVKMISTKSCVLFIAAFVLLILQTSKFHLTKILVALKKVLR